MKRRVSDIVFETLGVFFGTSASIYIVFQIITEWNAEKSSLSLPFLFGFLSIYLFWTVYGIKFKRIAMIITNGLVSILQILLIIAVV